MKDNPLSRIMKPVCLALLSIVALFPAGCATWKTPTLILYNGDASEAALLKVPFNVDIRYLDGVPVAKAFGQDEALIRIEPGSHTVEARYAILYPLPGSDFEKIQSDYYAFSFDCLPGGTYRIECNDPRTLEGARRFARTPVFSVLPRVTVLRKTPIPPAPAPVLESDRPVEKPRITPNTDKSSELKRVWENASPAERRAFLESMNPPHCETTEPVPAP
jgi:hypothetical protein